MFLNYLKETIEETAHRSKWWQRMLEDSIEEFKILFKNLSDLSSMFKH